MADAVTGSRAARSAGEVSERRRRVRSGAGAAAQGGTKDVERGRRALIVSFLEVLDNLDRAIESAAGRDSDPLVLGVSLVRQQFLSTLEGLGVTRIDPTGQPFDPVRHEAVSTIAAAGAQAGTVAGVVRPGYLIGDEVLRPAQVAVAGGE
jgi:molecular chaperone GrpE